MNDCKKLRIAPSILAADPGRLAEQAREAEKAGADYIHVDIMDGHFVPNLSFGPNIVGALRKAVKIPLDVHLMITQPDRYIRSFIEAGADIVTVHLEAPHPVSKTLKTIREMGAKCGLAINPPTIQDRVIPFLKEIDLLLCMTVNPGFGGQPFIKEVMEKVRFFRKIIDAELINCQIEVDGGVNQDTISLSAAAGANVFVCGTSVFANDIESSINKLRKNAVEASPQTL